MRRPRPVFKTSLDLFLNELVDIYEDVMRGFEVRANPAVVFMLGTSLTVAAALITDVKLFIPITASLLLSIAYLRISLRRVAKPFAVATLFAFLVALPALVNYLMHLHLLGIRYTDLIPITAFILRVSVSTLALTAYMSYLGWLGIIRALAIMGFPNLLTSSIALFIRYIPIQARDIMNMLMAREARTASSSYRASWALLSSVVGDLITRSMYRSQVLASSMEARGGFMRLRYRASITRNDVVLVVISLIPIVTYLVVTWAL